MCYLGRRGRNQRGDRGRLDNPGRPRGEASLQPACKITSEHVNQLRKLHELLAFKA
jgi:hypothetical protein